MFWSNRIRRQKTRAFSNLLSLSTLFFASPALAESMQGRHSTFTFDDLAAAFFIVIAAVMGIALSILIVWFLVSAFRNYPWGTTAFLSGLGAFYSLVFGFGAAVEGEGAGSFAISFVLLLALCLFSVRQVEE